MGGLIGLILGGILSTIDWHLIFLISVPVGILGAVWSYLALHEIAKIRENQKVDILGNVTFGVALTLILISMTYGLLPYGTSNTGWSSPYVIGGIITGLLLLVAFVFIELRAKDPMFNLYLFKIRAFSAGILSLFLAGIARGGLQFMLIIWLQGIWLPLHGVSFVNTPLQAGIDMIPLLLGFLVMGPVAGHLSDKYGARLFSTLGMIINVIGFLLLMALPVNFSYPVFALIIFVLGIGQGMFAAPNTTSVMNAVPPEHRGITAGMRATFTNMSFMFSIVIFFTLLVIGLGTALPSALYTGLIAQSVPAAAAHAVSQLPPTSALFAALLGYNPMLTLLPHNVTVAIPKANLTVITGNEFFPDLVSAPFADGIHSVLIAAVIMSAIAAVASALRGKRFVYGR
jgi:MFS family permease